MKLKIKKELWILSFILIMLFSIRTSAANVKVICINGEASEESFLYSASLFSSGIVGNYLNGCKITKTTYRNEPSYYDFGMLLLNTRKEMHNDDITLFYYSGHGTIKNESRGLSLKNNSCYPFSKLYDDLKRIPGKKYVIIDSCYSGNIITQAINDPSPDPSHFYIITACGEDQYSPYYNKLTLLALFGKKVNVTRFSNTVYEALGLDGNNMRADTSLKDDRVTEKELASYVRTHTAAPYKYIDWKKFLEYTIRTDVQSYGSASFSFSKKPFSQTNNPQKPASQGITKVSNAKKGITIVWPKSSNASGYNIYRKENSGSWRLLKKISNKNTVSYTDTTASNGAFYAYTVRGYIGSVEGDYNKNGLSIVRLRNPYGISKCISNSVGEVDLTWDKNGAATGYQIAYSMNSNFSGVKKIKVKSSLKTTTLSGLTQGKKYYFKIQSYKRVNGRNYFSSYSGVKSVTVKKNSGSTAYSRPAVNLSGYPEGVKKIIRYLEKTGSLTIFDEKNRDKIFMYRALFTFPNNSKAISFNYQQSADEYKKYAFYHNCLYITIYEPFSGTVDPYEFSEYGDIWSSRANVKLPGDTSIKVIVWAKDSSNAIINKMTVSDHFGIGEPYVLDGLGRINLYNTHMLTDNELASINGCLSYMGCTVKDIIVNYPSGLE